jgi:hypothetical protein
VSSNACQRSEEVAGAKAAVFFKGLLIAVFFFVIATSLFLGASSAFASFLFSLIKILLIKQCNGYLTIVALVLETIVVFVVMVPSVLENSESILAL